MHEEALRKEICDLFARGIKKKAIARRLAINVKTVRRILNDAELSQAPPPEESKLDPYKPLIQELAAKKLTGARILREIREVGYRGGPTILNDYLRTIRGPMRKKVKRYNRFETSPAQEAQIDWSPYRIVIGGILHVVHCFSMILCYSRHMFIQFHRNERLQTLLAAHVAAFQFFCGVCRRLVYDNMSQVTYGRRGKKPLWTPVFLDFAQHWAFEPWACWVNDPNRKGKIERPFQYIESSLLAGRSFASWEELDRETMHWLRHTANCRKHGTTGRVPERVWQDEERHLLTAAPDEPFPTYREEVRSVYTDGTVPVDGVRYPVPANLKPGQPVTTRVHPRHIEVLDGLGNILAKHKIPDGPERLVIDPARPLERRSKASPQHNLDGRFLTCFPDAQPFLDGLKGRMKGLYRIHLLKILRLAQSYGLDNTAVALAHAQDYGNFNGHAIERILRQRHPLIATEPDPIVPLRTHVLCQLDDVETNSLSEYRCHDVNQNEEETHENDCRSDAE